MSFCTIPLFKNFSVERAGFMLVATRSLNLFDTKRITRYMELSQVVRHDNRLEATWTSICTFLRQYSSGMSKRYSPIFESLARAATPFGGNVLAGAHEQARTRLFLSQQEIREQVDRLTREITRLNAQVSAAGRLDKSGEARPARSTDSHSVGLDRFRQEKPNTPAA